MPLRPIYQVCLSVVAGLACCFAISGCAVQQLHNDHNKIRAALLDLYTDQIIDNLIRAYNGLPIIQLDYTNATAQVTVQDTATLSDNLMASSSTLTTSGLNSTLTNTSASGATATMSATPSTVATAMATVMSSLASAYSTATTHGIVNAFNASSMHSNGNQVALTATPVTTSNDVYDHYIYFLGLGSEKGETRGPSLLVSDKSPPPGVAQICKRCGKLYYWVPIEYRKEFFALSLATTAQRGNPVSAPEYYKRKVIDVADEPLPMPTDGQNRIQFALVLDQSVPNGRGNIVIDNQTIDFLAYQTAKGVRPTNTRTIKLVLDFSQTPDKLPFKAQNPDAFVSAIRIQQPTVSLDIYGHPAGPLTTEQLLDRANFNLQQIQFNQLRGTGP